MRNILISQHRQTNLQSEIIPSKKKWMQPATQAVSTVPPAAARMELTQNKPQDDGLVGLRKTWVHTSHNGKRGAQYHGEPAEEQDQENGNGPLVGEVPSDLRLDGVERMRRVREDSICHNWIVMGVRRLKMFYGDGGRVEGCKKLFQGRRSPNVGSCGGR
jgi:hypothetical protein